MDGDGLNVPLWAIPVIGTIEVIGALLFIFPRTSFYGGVVLLGVLFGAFVTHILNADWAGVVQPLRASSWDWARTGAARAGWTARSGAVLCRSRPAYSSTAAWIASRRLRSSFW